MIDDEIGNNDNVQDPIDPIEVNIIAQIRKIWRNITTHTTQHLPYGLIFEKNTKGHIRTDDHIYIPASTFFASKT